MKKNITHLLFVIILWLILGGLTSLIIWGLYKGFDFSDESLNMLLFSPSQENILKSTPIFFVIGKITNFCGPDILFWRISKLLLLFVSASIFCYGFLRWVRAAINIETRYSFNVFYPIVCIATLINYAYGYQGLSYNSLTLILVQITTGLFFLYLSDTGDENNNILKFNLLLFSIGFFLYLLFLTKSTSGIILFIIISFLCISLKKSQIVTTVSIILNLLLGILFATIIITIFYVSPLEIISGIKGIVKFVPSHNIQHLLNIYVNDFWDNFIVETFIRHPIITIGPILMLLLIRNGYDKIFVFIFICSLIYIAKDVIFYEYYQSGMSYMTNTLGLYKMLFLFLFFFTILITIDKYTRLKYIPSIKNNKAILKGLILLIIIPFICSVGTNNLLSIHISQFLFSWILLFVITLYFLFSVIDYTDPLFKISVLGLMLNIAIQIINGFVYSPYRLYKPLTEQKYNVPELRKGNTILFDYESSLFLKKIANTFKSHHIITTEQPIISLYNYPGLTYLFGGLSPGVAWYMDPGYEGFTRANCYFISASKMKNLKNTILLVENDCPIPQEFIGCLSEKGIFFNENYILIDSVQKPHEKGKILLYVPKHQ